MYKSEGNKINLTKIQSVPIPHNTSAYAFHLDLEFIDKQLLEQTMKEIDPYVISQKILGIYKKGNSENKD